jgi:uncharacterized damage-inducible protein DinB
MQSLAEIFDGWDGHQQSLVNAIAPLDSSRLLWRPNEKLDSVGELARHISLARIVWFLRMNAPGSQELAARVPGWEVDGDGNQQVVESSLPIAEDADQLVHWLEGSWQMIATVLSEWTTTDLARRYPHRWNGTLYSVSYQWTLWRILTHDVHHGGQLSHMLGMQGIEVFELGDLFGHINFPPVADSDPAESAM